MVSEAVEESTVGIPEPFKTARAVLLATLRWPQPSPVCASPPCTSKLSGESFVERKLVNLNNARALVRLIFTGWISDTLPLHKYNGYR